MTFASLYQFWRSFSRKNGLSTAFKPFFDIILCAEHGLIFPFLFLFQTSKCSTGANNSNASVCYIIKTASNRHYIPSFVFFTIISIRISFSCKSFIFHININSIFIVGIKNYTISLIVSNMV